MSLSRQRTRGGGPGCPSSRAWHFLSAARICPRPAPSRPLGQEGLPHGGVSCVCVCVRGCVHVPPGLGLRDPRCKLESLFCHFLAL